MLIAVVVNRIVTRVIVLAVLTMRKMGTKREKTAAGLVGIVMGHPVPRIVRQNVSRKTVRIACVVTPLVRVCVKNAVSTRKWAHALSSWPANLMECAVI
jgi:uncharacterized protein YqgC (DUF456 family)